MIVLFKAITCSVTNPTIKQALSKLNKLEGCEAHASYMVTNGDLKSLKKLKINITSESVFRSDTLY